MQREVLLRFGQTGSGKTFSAAQDFAKTPRAIVAECDFGEFPSLRFDEFPDLVLHLEKLGAFSNKAIPFRVSYTPRFHEQHLMFMLAKEAGCCKLFLEEGDRFGDPRDVWEYDELVTRGRHWGVSLEFIGLHPYLCPIDLRRQATKIISFRQTEPNDIAWLAQKVGELAYQLPDLSGPPQAPPHSYLYWDSATGSRIVAQ